MAHNINTYIGRQSAWHNLGTVTGKYMTWAEILAAGGLDFDVNKEQLFDANGNAVKAYGTFRSDNHAFLGAVGETYTVINHAAGFEMIDALVGSVDGAHYETAGVLGAGEMVWGLADLQLTARVGDDVQNGYLLFSTSHDGTLSHTYRTCLTRVVCNNTLNVALGEKTKSVFRIRHSKNSVSRLQDAHDALSTIQGDVQTMEQKLNFLATRKVTRESVTDIFDRLFPKRKDADGQDINTTRRANNLAEILAAYESNDGDAFPEQRGTAYNLLNAITNYTDHSRSAHNAKGNGTGRAESAMFGSGDRLKSSALEVILEAADGMPVMKTRTVFATAPLPALQPVENSMSPMLDALLVAAGA
jgi:phage/plasmid-like protein (TIGR03299 family)